MQLHRSTCKHSQVGLFDSEPEVIKETMTMRPYTRMISTNESCTIAALGVGNASLHLTWPCRTTGLISQVPPAVCITGRCWHDGKAKHPAAQLKHAAFTHLAAWNCLPGPHSHSLPGPVTV